MIYVVLILASVALAIGIVCAGAIRKLQDGFGALKESYAQYDQSLTEVDSQQIEARITAVAMEIRRHMSANRSDFEMQALRRITYCEEHVDLVTRRFDEAELTNFTKNPEKKTRPKRKK